MFTQLIWAKKKKVMNLQFVAHFNYNSFSSCQIAPNKHKIVSFSSPAALLYLNLLYSLVVTLHLSVIKKERKKQTKTSPHCGSPLS